MSSAARNLAAVAILAVVIAIVAALGGITVYRATQPVPPATLRSEQRYAPGASPSVSVPAPSLSSGTPAS